MHASSGKQSRWSRIDAAGAGVCILISLLWYLTTISPLLKQQARTADLRRKITERKQESEQLKTATTVARRQLEAARLELETNGIELDSAAHINKRIAGLTDFFSDCTLHIDDVQTGRISTGLQCDLVPITIVGRGDYPHCVQFLHGLSSTFPDMSMMRIEFRGTPAPVSQPEQFRFDMFWYAATNHEIGLGSGPQRLVASGSRARE